ncbi:MAG: efflux transporter outer membrane subunit [Tepidisphaeraceae bacterium]
MFAAVRVAGVMTAATVIAGCTVGPDYQAPKTRVGDSFGATTLPTSQPTTMVDLTRWWESFNDQQLNRLLVRAVESNLDVKLAESRVRQARAELQGSNAGFFPTLDASGGYTRTRSSTNARTGVPANAVIPTETDLYRAGFDAGWEIDIFGGTRRAVESAQASFEASIESRRGVLVSLLAEVAQNYVALRGYQHQLQIVQRNVKAQSETVDYQRTRLKAGIATDLTVAQAESLLASTQAQIPGLETSIRQTIHRLSVLIDREPEALLKELSSDVALPVGPPNVPPGLPSDLLRRRPDVRQAERQLASATANIGVATADYYPRFTLNGSLGLSSTHFSNWGDSPSTFFSFGPGVTWRLFDFGRIAANIRIQNALQEQAFIGYRQSILNALLDVENALVAYNREQARRASLQDAVAANRRAVQLASQLYDAGVVDFLNVLNARQSLYQSEDQLAQSETIVSTNLVALYKALGGGWETTETIVIGQHPTEANAVDLTQPVDYRTVPTTQPK